MPKTFDLGVYRDAKKGLQPSGCSQTAQNRVSFASLIAVVLLAPGVPAKRDMLPREKFTHQTDHDQRQSDVNRVFEIRELGVVVQEGGASNLIDDMKKRVPIKHRDHAGR